MWHTRPGVSPHHTPGLLQPSCCCQLALGSPLLPWPGCVSAEAAATRAGRLCHPLLGPPTSSWRPLPDRSHMQETLIGRAQGTHLCPSSKGNGRMSSFKEAGLIPQGALQTGKVKTMLGDDKHEKGPHTSQACDLGNHRSSPNLGLSCLRCKMRIIATGRFVQAGAECDALLRPAALNKQRSCFPEDG